MTHGEQTSAMGLTSDGVSHPLLTATLATGALMPDARPLSLSNCRNQSRSFQGTHA
jgi:hypothetical protein